MRDRPKSRLTPAVTATLGQLPQPNYAALLPAPFGVLGLRIRADRLIGIDFLPPPQAFKPPVTALAQRVARQLAAYLNDPSIQFNLPIELDGTPFRRRVWQAITAIPLGETRTYGELAATLGSSARAVGQAVGDNPLPIIVPCHRVVGRWDLGGFNHDHTGYGIEIKRWLLRHEGILA